MILIKDIWIGCILPLLGPFDLARFQQTSKQSLFLTKQFQPFITKWKRRLQSGDFTYCFEKASKHGHKDLIDFFIDKTDLNDLNFALYQASSGGHRWLVHWFVSKGADDWDAGMEGASLGTYCEAVKKTL